MFVFEENEGVQFLVSITDNEITEGGGANMKLKKIKSDANLNPSWETKDFDT